MKRLFPILFTLFITYCSNSQEISVELPNITPPSPNAYEITKYGDVPIIETTGKIIASVPLYTFKSGKLELPIGLSYVGAGVKIDQLSGWTGINWVLNAGGAITRVVRDRPDEFDLNYRILYSQNELSGMDLNDGGLDVARISNLDSGNIYDTQTDLFNFSFSGYSGSFYLDENLTPKLANYDTELDIEFLGGIQYITNQTIVITTPDGVKYYFGGINTEQSRIISSNNQYGNMLSPTTSYYLYQITHPFGDIITLTYASEYASDYGIKLSISEQYTKVVIGGSQNNFCGSSAPTGYSSETIFNKVYNGKFLTKITSNRSNIKILFSSDATPSSNIHFKRVLNNVKVVDDINFNNNETFVFSYKSSIPILNSNRFFLEKVDFLNFQNNKLYDYHFEYNDPLGLPERFSFSKDYSGYYNGKNNSSTLPKNNNPYFQDISGFTSLADREPDFNFAIKGSLTKIHYPTGGNTFFEYEAPKISREEVQFKRLTAYCNLSEMYPNAYPIPDTKLVDTHYIRTMIDDTQVPVQSLGLYKDQAIKFNINAVAQGYVNHHYKVYIKIEDLTIPSKSEERYFVLANGVYSYNHEFIFNLIKDHIYNFKLILEPDPAITGDPYPVEVIADFEYIKEPVMTDYLGVRIKRITDNPINSQPTIKRYYYQKAEDIGTLNNLPIVGDLSSTYIYDSKYLVWCVNNTPLIPSGFPISDQHSLITLKSDSFNSIFLSSDKQWPYNGITISYGGDNFENGGVQRMFKNSPIIYPIQFIQGAFEYSNPSEYSTQNDNAHIYNDKMLSEVFIKSIGENLFVNKEVKYSYNHVLNEFVTNMIIQKMYNDNNLNSINNLYIGLYKTYSNKFNLASQTTTDFIEPVPINDINNSNSYNNITTSTNYFYDNPNLLQLTRTEVIDSKGDRLIMKTSYPDDVTSITSLGPDPLSVPEKAAIDQLKKGAQHRIAEPIQVETKVIDIAGTVLSESTQRTNYVEWYPNTVLPGSIETLKGAYNATTNNTETRLRFLSYYPNGNVKEVSKENGTHIIYIWGYQQTQPIAKIENATFVGLSSAIQEIIDTAVIASNNDINLSSENNLRTALNALRSSLPNAMVTTYTYDPLIGVTSITDPKGEAIYYHYDNFNRLEYVKDAQGNILSKNEYRYKGQL